MTDSTKHRASTTHSGRARNDETTRPKGTSDAQRGMGSKGGDGSGKRPPTPGAHASAAGQDEGEGTYEQRKEGS
jgi:hypothetical protein